MAPIKLPWTGHRWAPGLYSFFMGWKELVRARAGYQSQSSWPGVGLEGGQDAGPSCAGCWPRLALLLASVSSSIEGGDTALESQRLSQPYSHTLRSCMFWGVLAFLTLSEVGQLLISQCQQSSRIWKPKGSAASALCLESISKWLSTPYTFWAVILKPGSLFLLLRPSISSWYPMATAEVVASCSLPTPCLRQ